MKEWSEPEIKELGVESTEHGLFPSDTIDDVYVDVNNNVFYSFS